MSRITHEIVVRDRGLKTERVTLRSNTPGCPGAEHLMCDTEYYESGLPADMTKYLMSLMQCHHEALARRVGHAWIGEES